MGKEENLYAKEFIEYYVKLGFDHLFIYDNNDPGTEKISSILEDKYRNHVTIYETIKYNITCQAQAFTICYKNNKLNYNWILMADMDEYLYIVNDSLKNYLSSKVFKKCDFIKYYWVLPTDNNLLHYEPKPLFERFKGPYLIPGLYKTMVRGNISNLVYHVHFPQSYPPNKLFCNSEGNIISDKFVQYKDEKHLTVKKAYLLHFRFKSTEEFIKKYKRGYSNWHGKKANLFLQEILAYYFWLNKITPEKINYIEKELNLSLKSYKERYKKEHNLTEIKKSKIDID